MHEPLWHFSTFKLERFFYYYYYFPGSHLVKLYFNSVSTDSSTGNKVVTSYAPKHWFALYFPTKKIKIIAMKPEVLLRSDNFVLMSWIERLNEQCTANGAHVKSP